MGNSSQAFIVGLDNGGTMNNATVLDPSGQFLVEHMLELPSRVREGPDLAIESLAASFDQVLDVTGVDRAAVAAVGLDTPGPASADGILSSRGATNFGHPGWAASTSAPRWRSGWACPSCTPTTPTRPRCTPTTRGSGDDAPQHSSVAVIVGTGLGGGLVEAGQVVSGVAGMAGELGHVQIPLEGLLEEGQPVPACNCGLRGDVESFASLSGIEQNLLPYWLTRYPGTGSPTSSRCPGRPSWSGATARRATRWR